MAVVTQIRNKHSDCGAYFDRKLAEGKTRNEALPSLMRRFSDTIYALLQDDARRSRQASKLTAREGNRGTALTPARPAHTPSAGSSDKPLPGLPPPYGPGRQVPSRFSRTEPTA